jgi:hypothetical protein
MDDNTKPTPAKKPARGGPKVRDDDGRKGNPKFTDAERDKALQLAAVIGIRPAARQLKMSYCTLRDWTVKQPKRWAEIRKVEAPAWRERIAVPLEDLVSEYVDVQKELLEQLRGKREDLDTRDISTALRSVSVAMGIGSDKVEKFRDRPDHTVEHKISAEQLERAMERLLTEGETVDSTAEELPALVEGEADDS